MSEDAARLNEPAKTAKWNLSLAEAFHVLGRRFRLCARVAVVLLYGFFLLVTLLALQVATLELTDRLNIFPLYGFFFMNVLCGVFLSWFIVRSWKRSTVRYPGTLRLASVLPGVLGRLRAALMGVLNIEPKAQTRTQGKRVAVLLIIKRQASAESKQQSRAVAA